MVMVMVMVKRNESSLTADIFPGCSNGFLNGDFSPIAMHLEEKEGD